MTAKLERYTRKRDFQKTGEPIGKAEKSGVNFRFVVQRHLARNDHFDFRLEWDGVLLSWAIPKGPSYNPDDKRLAVRVEDHPLEYRDFEGTIPKGEYGGGTVMLWDEGIWEPVGDVEQELEKGSLKFLLKGKRLSGKWALIRMKAKEGNEEKNWLLFKEKDEYAGSSGKTNEWITSIRTGRTMEQIAEGKEVKTTGVHNPFSAIDVQLAKLVEKQPEGPDWLYELKYDGYRIVAYVENGRARLVTRNGQDYTAKFKRIADSLIDWAAGRAMVLDGEMVIADTQGRTDFQALQSYLKNPKDKDLTYIVFDLLALDGEDLRGRRLIERKETLKALMERSPQDLHYSAHARGTDKDVFRAACQANMEGIVGKKADSVYSGTRNGDWIKLKCDTRQEFVIGGYTLTDTKTSGISALLLGVYEGDAFLYAGRAGTGLAASDVKELLGKFESIRRSSSPFNSPPAAKTNETITWVEPALIAEIKFAQWTEDNLLRQASYKGLRTDKNPKEVRREAVHNGATGNTEPEKTQFGGDSEQKRMKTSGKNTVIGGVSISSPDKVMFEGTNITKADVARYYEKVAERMMPYVGNRILSILRCPDGISGSCFYQKHPGPDAEGIVRIPVSENDGEKEYYFYIESPAGILSEVQMGTLEFHVWGSRVDHLEMPDTMVFDLDPDQGLSIDTVRQGARDIKGLLKELSLRSFLKTSGGKGYHVVVPLEPSAGWDAFYGFAKKVAEAMEGKWPDRYTTNVRKVKRKGKIFVDWMRNGRSATSVAPYSIRARSGASVSMPIAWDELDAIAPDGIRMEQAIERAGREDPWKDFYRTGQSLKADVHSQGPE